LRAQKRTVFLIAGSCRKRRHSVCDCDDTIGCVRVGDLTCEVFIRSANGSSNWQFTCRSTFHQVRQFCKSPLIVSGRSVFLPCAPQLRPPTSFKCWSKNSKVRMMEAVSDVVGCSPGLSPPPALVDPLLRSSVGLDHSTRDWFTRQCFLEFHRVVSLTRVAIGGLEVSQQCRNEWSETRLTQTRRTKLVAYCSKRHSMVCWP
jgi:hypothetical protein